MRVAAVQMGALPGNAARNVKRACSLIDEAVSMQGADLVILPEFFNTEYFPQYADVSQFWGYAEPREGPSLTVIREKAREHTVWIIAPLYEEAAPGFHYDSAFLVDPTGEIEGCYRKTHAPAIAGGYEKLYYTPGSNFPVFELGEWRVGIAICYDWRYPEVARALSVQDAELIVLPFATPRMRMWEAALATRAWENQVYVAVCNKVGKDGAWDFFGTSLIADPYGEVLVTASSTEEQVIAATLDRSVVQKARLDDFNWRDRRPEMYTLLTKPGDLFH